MKRTRERERKKTRKVGREMKQDKASTKEHESRSAGRLKQQRHSIVRQNSRKKQGERTAG